MLVRTFAGVRQTVLLVVVGTSFAVAGTAVSSVAVAKSYKPKAAHRSHKGHSQRFKRAHPSRCHVRTSRHHRRRRAWAVRRHRQVCRGRRLHARRPVVARAADSMANSFGSGIFGVAAGGDLQNEGAGMLGSDLSVDRGAGARWLRFDINWAQIQSGGPSSFDWGADDAVVRGAVERGMHLLGVILYTPSWDRPAGSSASFAPSVGSYAAFAGRAAERYAALGVHAFEVWNEPNSPVSWQPAPSPAAYTQLLRAAYVAIKRADPSATVLTGGTAPAPSDGKSYSPVDFLSGIYASGGKGYFDAVGHHPYCAPAFPGAGDEWSAWYQMYGTSPSLRSVMVAHGDGDKKIWATEFGAPTGGPAGSHVSESEQAGMVSRAYQLFAGYSWAGPLFFYQGRDQGTDTSTPENHYGFLHHDFTPKPSYTAYKQAAANP